MARNPLNYSRNQAAVAIGGVPLVDFADGDAIEVALEADQSSITTGLDRSVTNLNSNRSGTITVRLKPTSPSNDYLKGLLTAQQAGIFLNFPAVVLSGTLEIHSGTGGSVRSVSPAGTGGEEMTQREWVLQFEELSLDS